MPRLRCQGRSLRIRVLDFKIPWTWNMYFLQGHHLGSRRNIRQLYVDHGPWWFEGKQARRV